MRIPPSQRSSGATSTRSALPASTSRAERRQRVTRVDMNSRASPRGGGAGALDQRHELRQPLPRPRVAEEDRLLARLTRQVELARPPRTVEQRLEQLPFGARETALRVRQLFEQPRASALCRCGSGEVSRSSRAARLRPARAPGTRPTPRGRAHACAASPWRRCGQSASSSSGWSGPRVRVRLDQLERRVAGQGRAPAGAATGRRGRARTRAPRSCPLPAPARRAGRAARTTPAATAPSPSRSRSGTAPALPAARPAARPAPALVEHVLPREHRAAKRRLSQRVAGALAVRHVEQRPEPRVAPAAREERRAAGAMVERVAGAPDDARELLAHTPQAGDPLVDLVQLLARPASAPPRVPGRHAVSRACSAISSSGEAEPLRLLDGLHETHRLLVVVGGAR